MGDKLNTAIATGALLVSLAGPVGAESAGKTVEIQKEADKTRIMTETKSQTQRLLLQCDGIDREGVIHEENKNGEIDGFPEKKCVRQEELLNLTKENAQLDQENAQLDQDIENLKKKISKKIKQS